MADTIAADFGHRSRHESLIADGMTVLNEIDHLASHLRRWMKPRRVGVGWRFWPARAEVRQAPVGVVGVISPWNYPVNLALIPLATAIAAGNHVYLKPSEHTPRTTAFLRSLLAEVFPLERVAVAAGGAPVSELRVDGGACVNDLLMQFQADLLGIPVVRPAVIETTALGAAYLAGLSSGVYASTDELSHLGRADRRFVPTLSNGRAQELMANWEHAVRQTTAE